MKRKPPKPKTPKSPESIRTARAKPTGNTHPIRAATPSPEWLAEMAARILALDNFPLIQAGIKPAGGAERGEIGQTLKLGMFAAYRFYEEAKGFLDFQQASEVGLEAPFFSPEESKTGHVEFGRGCQLITGEPKRQRAIQKYTEWAIAVGIAPVIDGKPRAQGDKGSGFLTSTIMPAMVAYEEFSKKPLDLGKSQYAPHPGHNAKTVRQKRKRRGPRLPKLGQ